jgi:Peptidase A4 family
MKIHTVLAGLCAGSALAAPFTELRRERRAARSRSSLPHGNFTGIEGVNTQYDSNWAGAVLIGNSFTSVTATIVVPTPQTPSGGNAFTQYAATAWVGIDGDTCQSAILQTGVDFWIQDGQPTFDGWYEWYPEASSNFNGFQVSAGDTIEMTVTASSTTSGKATLNNLSTGQSVSHTFRGSNGGELCLTNAEWIVEDFSEGGSLVPFADFSTVTFTGASAVSGGSTVDTSGSTIVDIKQNNKVLTSCSASGSEVTCSYQ